MWRLTVYIVLFQKTFVSRFWPRNYGKVRSFSFLWILSSSPDASVHSMNLTCKWIYAKFSKELPWSWFALTRFWLRTLTHVDFNHANKIEAGCKVLRLNVKLSEVLLFRLRAAFHTLPLFYLRNPLLTKPLRLRWLNISLAVWRFYGPQFVSLKNFGNMIQPSWPNKLAQ